jgi:hypothetical protein
MTYNTLRRRIKLLNAVYCIRVKSSAIVYSPSVLSNTLSLLILPKPSDFAVLKHVQYYNPFHLLFPLPAASYSVSSNDLAIHIL